MPVGVHPRQEQQQCWHLGTKPVPERQGLLPWSWLVELESAALLLRQAVLRPLRHCHLTGQ